jgi:hypothetical protein
MLISSQIEAASLDVIYGLSGTTIRRPSRAVFDSIDPTRCGLCRSVLLNGSFGEIDQDLPEYLYSGAALS